MTSKEEYDNLEKAIMHYWAIGEVLIDVSKGYISEDIALKKIKEYMRIADVFTHRDLKQIKKDLKVLEILKKHIKLTSYKTVSGFKDEGMSDDEFEKVKEWLKDE